MNEHLFLGDSTYPHTPITEKMVPSASAGEVVMLSKYMHQRLIGRIEQLERELAGGKLSRLDSECLRIGQQIHRAAGNLPEMFNIVIDIENGYGGVKLFNNAGDEFDFETDGDGLSYSIEKAINAAIQEGKA